MRTLVALVEGHSDVASVPTLVTRIANELMLTTPIIKPPIRFTRSRIQQEDELERLLGLARSKLQGGGCILILLDADDDCPAELGPRLAQAALAHCGDSKLAVVVAKRMFESWLVAGAEGLVEKRELVETEAPEQPEDVRSPKRWLSKRMQRLGGYGETADMKRLTGLFSLEHARGRSPSFDKLCRELDRLLRET